LALREECGHFGALVLMACDWDDMEGTLRSLELFAEKLRPGLNQAVVQS
jgi:hypothetical protein